MAAGAAVVKRRRVELDTSLLDGGINMDVDDAVKLAEEEYGCCFHGTCPKCKPFVSVWREPEVEPVRPKRVHASKFIPDHDW